MARLIPPPPRNNQEFDALWRDWLNLLWRRVKGLEPGESDGGDSNAIHSNVAGEIQDITQKGTPVDTDEFLIEDSADSYTKKALTWVNIKSTLNTYLGGLYLKLDASNDPITASLEIQGDLASTSVTSSGAISGTTGTYTGVVTSAGFTGTGVIENVEAKTANYTVVATDDNIVCDTSGGAFTITLPLSPETGRVYTVVLETGSSPLTIAGNGKNIMGDSSKDIIYAGTAIQLVYNGTQWSAK